MCCGAETQRTPGTTHTAGVYGAESNIGLDNCGCGCLLSKLAVAWVVLGRLTGSKSSCLDGDRQDGTLTARGQLVRTTLRPRDLNCRAFRRLIQDKALLDTQFWRVIAGASFTAKASQPLPVVWSGAPFFHTLHRAPCCPSSRAAASSTESLDRSTLTFWKKQTRSLRKMHKTSRTGWPKSKRRRCVYHVSPSLCTQADVVSRRPSFIAVLLSPFMSTGGAKSKLPGPTVCGD